MERWADGATEAKGSGTYRTINFPHLVLSTNQIYGHLVYNEKVLVLPNVFSVSLLLLCAFVYQWKCC